MSIKKRAVSIENETIEWELYCDVCKKEGDATNWEWRRSSKWIDDNGWKTEYKDRAWINTCPECQQKAMNIFEAVKRVMETGETFEGGGVRISRYVSLVRLCDTERKDGECVFLDPYEVELFSRASKVDFYPAIDWLKVKNNKEVLVSDDGIKWFPKHFKQYNPEKKSPYECYSHGTTSWTVGKECNSKTSSWNYCRPVEED